MTEKKPSVLFKIIKWLVKVFYPKTSVEGSENLPDEPVIIVGNHCQMNGPIVGELYVPGEPYIWCAGEMMHLKDVPEYAFRDFWSQNRNGLIRDISCFPTSLRRLPYVCSIMLVQLACITTPVFFPPSKTR